jgi:hypothetical protein
MSFIVMYVLSVSHAPCATLLSELGSYERVEEVAGVPFKYKVFFSDGEVMKDFFVDDVRVSDEVYYQKKQALYDREIEEAQERIKRAGEECMVVQNGARAKAYVRLIGSLKGLMHDVVIALRDPSIEPFVVVSEDAIPSIKDLNHIQHTFLPALNFVNEKGAIEVDTRVLKKLFLLCEEVHVLLVACYRATIEAAVEKADDPSALKKLLELL